MASGKKRKSWDYENMRKAYEAVEKKEMGYLKASIAHNVPKSTLEDYVKSPKDIEDLLSARLGRKTTFSPDIEDELVKYCLEMVQKYYGLRANDIRHMAFELAVKNHIPHRFTNGGKHKFLPYVM